MPDFPFSPKLIVDAAELCEQADHTLGHVGVEVIAHHLPPRRPRLRSEQIVQERHEIGLGAAVADGADDLAGSDVKRRYQGFCAMADIFELPPFDMPGLHRQAWGGAFQRLDTGHLVDRNGLPALFGGCGGGLIDRADVGTFGVEFRIRLRRQPVTVAMRLEIGLFFKNRPTEPCEMLLTMPRATDCRANSLWLQ